MRKPLSGLEQVVMDYVWAHPRSTAEACRADMAAAGRPLKESTIRTLLRRLEEKGYVTHAAEGRTYLYRAAEARHSVAARAVRQIVDRFCGGSVEELLVGMVDNQVVGRRELERMARRVAAKKKERT